MEELIAHISSVARGMWAPPVRCFRGMPRPDASRADLRQACERDKLCALRAKRGMCEEQAREQLRDASYFGTMLVVLG